MSKDVLMCGGPADGRWVVVDNPSRDWTCVTPDWTGSVDPAVPVADGTTTHRYVIYREVIFGQILWVGVLYQEVDHRRPMMRTVLQRDVAQHLGAYR
jgi:hypothetical protein